MVSERISSVINDYRGRIIEGKIIDLVPFSMADAQKVVEIRNRQKNKHFFNQTFELTVEDQARWFESYLSRTDDIYWCIYNKDNNFIGTIRVYDIDETEDICDQGSFIIDEDFAGGAPYAIEAELMSLDFIFEKLQISNVINEDKIDNKVMNNLSKRIGFVYKKDTENNGVACKYYLLSPEDYKKNRGKFQMVIDYWASRG